MIKLNLKYALNVVHLTSRTSSIEIFCESFNVRFSKLLFRFIYNLRVQIGIRHSNQIQCAEGEIEILTRHFIPLKNDDKRWIEIKAVKIKFGSVRTRGTKRDNELLIRENFSARDKADVGDLFATRLWTRPYRNFIYDGLHWAGNMLSGFIYKGLLMYDSYDKNIIFGFDDISQLMSENNGPLIPLSHTLRPTFRRIQKSAFENTQKSLLALSYNPMRFTQFYNTLNNPLEPNFHHPVWQKALLSSRHLSIIEQAYFAFSSSHNHPNIVEVIRESLLYTKRYAFVEDTHLYSKTMAKSFEMIYNAIIGASIDADNQHDLKDIQFNFSLSLIEDILWLAKFISDCGDSAPPMSIVLCLLQIFYSGCKVFDIGYEFGRFPELYFLPHNEPLLYDYYF